MSEEFCDGVKILLKRMESNPEEFKGQDSKWSNLIPKGSGGYYDWSHALTEDERNALAEGVRMIQRNVYTEKVMQVLLHDTNDDSVSEELTKRYAELTVPPGTWASTGGLGGGGSGMLGSPYQNVYNATSDTSLATRLKNKLKFGL